MDFKLVSLGSSAAGPVPGRWASAQWFKLGSTGFLCDCAEGTQIALQQVGIGWSEIDYILISHLHGDHFYGLPGLLTSWGLNQRKRALTIIGPAGLEAWIMHTLELSYAQLPFQINWQVSDPAAAPQTLAESERWTLSSLPLIHRIPSQGFLLREKPRQPNMNPAAIQQYDIPFQQIPAIKAGGDFMTKEGVCIPHAELTTPPVPPRSFAYCSDTAYNSALIPLLANVDMVYHEATFLHDMLEQAEYTGHTTCRQAAELALAADVKQLIIGHFSTRYGNLSPLLAEARAVFPNTHLAELGKTFEVAFPGRG